MESNCTRVALWRCSVRRPQRILLRRESTCAEDSARYSFAAARILRARSTTMEDVTWFMQA
jgi:hypothetical protein